MADEIFSGTYKFIAVSEYIRSCILTVDNKPEKVSVLRNVVNIQKFEEVSDEVRTKMRREYNIAPDDVVYAFFGRMIPEKGAKELVLAFKKLRETHKNIRLMLVGSEWFGKNTQSSFINEIREISSDIEESIVFTGFVDYNYIQNQYSCADVVVMPSIIQEAAGMVIIEAMSASKPLIVSDSGGIPEYAKPSYAIEAKRGENFVSELYEAMKKLASDEELRKAMGCRAREAVAEYNKNFYLDKLLEIIGD